MVANFTHHMLKFFFDSSINLVTQFVTFETFVCTNTPLSQALAIVDAVLMEIRDIRTFIVFFTSFLVSIVLE